MPKWLARSKKARSDGGKDPSCRVISIVAALSRNTRPAPYLFGSFFSDAVF